MINQSLAFGIGISHIWGQDIDSGTEPGRALILLEDSITDAILMETGDYILQEY